MKFSCDQCGTKYTIDDSRVRGKMLKVRCKACQHLMPKSPPLTASQQQKLTAQALKFVACMRAHGLSAFPDPKVSSNGIEMQLPRSLIEVNDVDLVSFFENVRLHLRVPALRLVTEMHARLEKLRY